MALADWLCLMAALVSLRFAVAHNNSVESDTFHVSVGHLFLLRCHIAGAHTNVTWSRAGSLDWNLPNGVEVRDGLLWFLPVQTSHNGTYTCEKRDRVGTLTMKFGVLVSTGGCPDSNENISIPQGVSGELPCKQREIFRLNSTRNTRWMKGCLPVEPIFVDENGNMRLPKVSEKDNGQYTCIVDISLGDRKYTTARSIQLTICNDLGGTVIVEPELVFPQGEVVMVEVGMRAELLCLAYIGYSEYHGTLMYWTVDGAFTEEHEELEESWEYTHRRGRVYGLSTLSISKVLRLFLNVSIHCNILSPAGQKVGLVLLQEADHRIYYTSVYLCLTTFLIILALAAATLYFKIDAVLAYREVLRHFSKQASDGKLYDGYVSVLHPDILEPTQMANFALHILPEELETKHGYTLYIRGRDDSPGEAFHDATAAMVRLCRRLIIILSPEKKSSTDSKSEEVLSLCDNHDQLCYEQKIGIYDALIQNDPKVILVEIGGPVDYGPLPESLHYIKRKQGALKWKRANKAQSNTRFWKNLRYHMPSVPAGSLQTVE